LRVIHLKLNQKHSNALLLALMNSLADFDGQLTAPAPALLAELQSRADRLPPLYTDVFMLSSEATCADLVDRVGTLSQDQLAIASYAFQIFRFYEQILRAQPENSSPQQQAAYEAQLERVRLSVMRTRATLAETIGQAASDRS